MIEFENKQIKIGTKTIKLETLALEDGSKKYLLLDEFMGIRYSANSAEIGFEFIINSKVSEEIFEYLFTHKILSCLEEKSISSLCYIYKETTKQCAENPDFDFKNLIDTELGMLNLKEEIRKKVYKYKFKPLLLEETNIDVHQNLWLFKKELLEQKLKNADFNIDNAISQEAERRELKYQKRKKELLTLKKKSPENFKIKISEFKEREIGEFKERETEEIEAYFNLSFELEELRKNYNKTLSPKERVLSSKQAKILNHFAPSSFRRVDTIQINDNFKCVFATYDFGISIVEVFDFERFNQKRSENIEFLKNFDVENFSYYQLVSEIEFYKKRNKADTYEILNYLYEKAIHKGINENISKDNFYIILLEMASQQGDYSNFLSKKIELFKVGLKYLENHLKNNFPNDRKLLAELYLILGYLTRTTNNEEAFHWIDIACKFANEEQKIVFSKVIARIILDFALNFEEKNDYSNALSQLIFSNEYDDGFCGTNDSSYFNEKKNEILEKDAKHRAEQILKAKTEERDRIMSNLSHSIKNLIATVIDPLENLQREETYNSKTIENALRGTSLVRELVNAMNLSYKGTFDDFLFDAKEHSGNESLSLEQIILEALKYSVGNMFDGKYFANFMRNYFTSRESFNEGKEAWTNVSQTKDWEELSEFLNKYFFKLEIDLKDLEELVIGNQKGSVMKFTILFQEMLLNAVKYSSFVSKEQREIKISLAQNTKGITFEVQNPYKENVQTKSTGLGLEIIKNFSKLLRTEPKVQKENGVYTSSFTFQNLWEN